MQHVARCRRTWLAGGMLALLVVTGCTRAASPPPEPGPASPPASGEPAPAPPAGGGERQDAPGMLDTRPRGARVFADGVLLGTAPVPLERLPEWGQLTVVAPGHQVLQHFKNPGDDLEYIELPPLPAVSGDEVARERERLMASLDWDANADGWQLGPFPSYHWAATVSPDGQWVAAVIQGPSTEAGWGLDLLIIVDLAGGTPQVLAEQVRYPMAPGNGSDPESIGFRPVGWRDNQTLVVLQVAPREPGGELVLAARAYNVTGATPGRELAAMPLTIRLFMLYSNRAWLLDDAVYLSTDDLHRLDLRTGQVDRLRSGLPVYEGSGAVLAGLSPDGSRMDYGPVIDVATGTVLYEPPPGVQTDGGVWSPNSRLFALRLHSPDHPGKWLSGPDLGMLVPSALLILDRDGREVTTVTLPDGLHILVAGWTPDSRSLIVRAVDRPAEDHVENWRPADRSLYLVRLDGTAQLLRAAHSGYPGPVVVGPGWVAEHDWERQAWSILAWEGPAPPAPAPPVSEWATLLPGGHMVATGSGGEAWVCESGAAACRPLGRWEGFGADGPGMAGPWLYDVSWRDGLAVVTGFRWQ